MNIKANAEAVSKIKALVEQVSAHREKYSAWGEVRLLMNWKDGKIVEFKLLTEDICKVEQEKSATPR